MRRSFLGALAALVALGSAASAQDVVPFTTVAQGTHGGLDTPARLVIRSAAELQSTGVDELIPPGTAIDWNQEMLIAVAMGTQSSGGHGISVTGLSREQLATILPVPAPPPSFRLLVDVSERRPGPGEMVTAALTSPFHVVKCRRYGDRVEFQRAPLALDALVVHVRNQIGSRRFAFYRDGSCDLEVRPTPTSPTVRYTGVATDAEFAAVKGGLESARLASIPANLTPASPPLGSRRFTIAVTGGPSPRTIEGVVGFEGQYGQRLGYVTAATDAIAARLETPAVGIASGFCYVQGGEVFLQPHKSMSYRISPQDVADTLARFPNRLCRVEGTISRTGMFSADVVVTRIVSPVKSGDLAVAVDAAQRATVRGAQVELFGPTARAVRVLGRGKTVQVDGWLFEDEAGAPIQLRVEALNARATQLTTLVRSTGTFIAFVPANTRVKILNLSSGVTRSYVQAGSRRGYMLNSRLDVRAPAVTTATTGLVGGVP